MHIQLRPSLTKITIIQKRASYLYVAFNLILTYSPAVMGGYFFGLLSSHVPGSASITLSTFAPQNYHQCLIADTGRQAVTLLSNGSRPRKKDRHTQGIEYLSFVYSPSPSFLTGALTRCNVDFNSSFDQRMRKSPMLNTMAPGTGGAGMNTSLLC